MIRAIHKILIIGVFCLVAEHSFCQGAAIGSTVAVGVKFLDRWHALAMVQDAGKFGGTATNVFRFGGGAAFNVYENIHAVGGVTYGIADYNNIDNKDKMLTCIEGVVVLGENGRHDFSLMQRIIRYYPYDIKANNSILNYAYTRFFTLNDKWRLSAGAMIVINIHQDFDDSKILQRIKPRLNISRELFDCARISLSYVYMFCGKNQTYMLDRENLHSLDITFSWLK